MSQETASPKTTIVKRVVRAPILGVTYAKKCKQENLMVREVSQIREHSGIASVFQLREQLLNETRMNVESERNKLTVLGQSSMINARKN